MKVIGVVGMKGGSGKTSAAVPLAMQAAAVWPTVLLDVDPQYAASMWVKAAELQSVRLGVHEVGVDHLGHVLAEAREAEMGWAIIDTPANDKHAALSTMLESDVVLIPVMAGTGDMHGLAQTMLELAKARRHRPGLKELVVINRTTAASTMTRRTREMIDEAGLRVARTEIPSLKLYGEANGTVPQGRHYPELWNELMEVLT